ncbi:MAG: AAA family ATPase [Candidatus Nanoarchaeia archaeon]|nr:AAA family ATPase [Candidatus Nanoarchaeia archaeon]
MGRSIGIISIKGGVGKTTTTLNLGATLSHKFGKEVLIVDSNFTAPNLALHLGIVKPEATLHDVLRGDADVTKAILKYEEGLYILPSSLMHKRVNPLRLKRVIDTIKKSFDFILLDSSPNLNEEMLATMIAADELFVVTTPDYPTLSTTMRAIKLAKDKGTPINGLILNKVRGKNFELSIEDIEDAAEVPVLAVLPDDVGFLHSLSELRPHTLMNLNADSTVEFNHLAASLVNEEYQDTRFKTKVKRLFGSTDKTTKQGFNRTVFKDSRFSRTK